MTERQDFFTYDNMTVYLRKIPEKGAYDGNISYT